MRRATAGPWSRRRRAVPVRLASELKPSFFFRIALTCAGLALPFVAAITLPTSELNAFSLPARNSATIAGLAAITSSTIFSIAPASEICVRPFAAMIASASPLLAGPHRVEHVLRDLAGDRAVARCASAGRRAAPADTGACAMSSLALLSAADSSPSIQLATSLSRRASPPASACTAVSKYSASVAARRERRGVVRACRPYSRSKRALHRLGQLRQLRAHALDPLVVDHERRQVGIGEVAVVLRVFLAAHRARLAPVRIVEARLLHDACRRPRSARSAAAPRTRSPPA